jgi:hypothetical protein
MNFHLDPDGSRRKRDPAASREQARMGDRKSPDK